MRILYFINSITSLDGINRIAAEKINYFVNCKDCEVTIAYLGMEIASPLFLIDKRVKLRNIQTEYGGRSFIKRIWRIIKIRKTRLIT